MKHLGMKRTRTAIKGFEGHIGPACIFICIISVPLLTGATMYLREGNMVYAGLVVTLNIFIACWAVIKAVNLYRKECQREEEVIKQEIIAESLKDDPPSYEEVMKSPPPFISLHIPEPYLRDLKQCGTHSVHLPAKL